MLTQFPAPMADRKEQPPKWDKTPAINPRYEGATVEQVVRKVFRPMSDAELQELKARSRKKG